MSDIVKRGRPPKVVNPIDRAALEVINLHGSLESLAKKSAETIYRIGEILTAVKAELPHGSFTPWVEEHLPFTIKTAQRYMAVYERFKNDTVSFLGVPSITEAYIEAGVKKLLAGPEDEASGAPEPASYRTAGDAQLRFDEKLLDIPVKSTAVLRNYRVMTDGGYLVVGRLGVPPMTFGTIDFPFPEEAKEVETFIRDGIQQVIELGLARLEELEQQGVVAPPVDDSLSGQLGRAGRLTMPKKVR